MSMTCDPNVWSAKKFAVMLESNKSVVARGDTKEECDEDATKRNAKSAEMKLSAKYIVE